MERFDSEPSTSSSPGLADDFSIDAEDGSDGRVHNTQALEEAQRCPGCTPKNLEKKRRTIFASFALVVAGVVLLVAGAVLTTQTTQFAAGVALIVIGALCFLPGAYTSFLLIQVFRGKRGFLIDHVPD